MDKSSMLIDFNSPAHKKELSVPLIPVPPQVKIPGEEIREPSVDPFEVQETESPDPFEVVLQHAANNTNSEKIVVQELLSSTRSETDEIFVNFQNNGSGNLETDKMGKSETESSSHDGALNKINSQNDEMLCRHEIPKDCNVEILINVQNEGTENVETENIGKSETKDVPGLRSYDDALNKISPKHDQMLCRDKIPQDCSVDLEKLPNITPAHSDAPEALKNSLKSYNVVESDSQSQLSVDFSTEESLKAVIAKRVNRCIQEVLNESMKTNKKCNDSLFKKPQNKRSLSFIGLPSEPTKKECERLNKSCTDANNSFNLENQQLDASSNSSGFGLLSPNSTDVSTEGNVEEQVFHEARKLSRTFSKLAESFRLEEESESDDEDLMSCKPRWLFTDSSEDEEEKLLKDPSLNFRRRSDGSPHKSPATLPHNPKVSDSPALLAYKSRRSFTQLQSALDNQEEVTMKRSVSVGAQIKGVPTIPSLVPAGLLKTDDQPLKLRKKNFGNVKKGPLRAVMPLQSMTKEPFPAAGKILSKQDISPEARTQRPVYSIGTPNKDNSQLNIVPMASSTPNKEGYESSKSNISQLMKPVASVTANKRHSLEGSFGSHKSRQTITEEGARPRSNSVNSGIPRVTQVKPVRGLPLAPKSTSSLARSQINANNIQKVLVKKNTSQLKTDVSKARVLADVKSKSPRNKNKVKAAVSAISSLVRGKKSASRDKENRVPA